MHLSRRLAIARRRRSHAALGGLRFRVLRKHWGRQQTQVRRRLNHGLLTYIIDWRKPRSKTGLSLSTFLIILATWLGLPVLMLLGALWISRGAPPQPDNAHDRAALEEEESPSH